MATSFSGRNSINNRGVGVTTSVNANKFSNIQPQQPYIVSSASGGTLTEVNNYNGTTQTYRVHRFNSPGNLEITAGKQPFRYLLVGAGFDADRSGAGTGWGLPGASGGKVLDSQNQIIQPGTYSITIGTSNGANTTLGVIASSSAGANGGAGSGAVGSCGNRAAAGAGAAGPTSNITGTLTNYAGGGGGGGASCDYFPNGFAGYGGAGGATGGGAGGFAGGGGGNGGANTGGGGGGRAEGGAGPVGGLGGSGTAIIAYRHAYVSNVGF